MNDSKVRATDLNLLVTLAALLEAQNVSRAAEALGLSQPAVSHALNRLRETFDDALLVRSGRAMVPTPRAEALLPQVREVLADIERLLDANEDFNPEDTRRTFVVATNGFSAQLLIPALVHSLRSQAPHANLRITPTGHRDLRDLLTDGQVDACLISGSMDHLPESLMMRSLFEDSFVSTVREGHAFKEGQVSEAAFADASHILVSPRGDHLGVLDGMLAQRGMRRRVALVLPDFMTVPAILRSTDYVITTPVSISRLLNDSGGLRQFTPPGGLGLSGALIALWHERVQNDPVNRWFRRLIFDVSERMNVS